MYSVDKAGVDKAGNSIKQTNKRSHDDHMT